MFSWINSWYLNLAKEARLALLSFDPLRLFFYGYSIPFLFEDEDTQVMNKYENTPYAQRP